MSDYLALAKRASTKSGGRGRGPGHPALGGKLGEKTPSDGSFVVRWSKNPGCVELRNPATGEWHEVRAKDCFPSIVEAADADRRRRGDEGGAV